VVKIRPDNPVKATIQNNGEDFTGELTVVVTQGVTDQILIATPFTLGKGVEKEITMYVPIYTIQKRHHSQCDQE